MSNSMLCNILFICCQHKVKHFWSIDINVYIKLRFIGILVVSNNNREVFVTYLVYITCI